jgi:hypothetical protein
VENIDPLGEPAYITVVRQYLQRILAAGDGHRQYGGTQN